MDSGLYLTVSDDNIGSPLMLGLGLVMVGVGASTENKSSMVGKSTELSQSKSGHQENKESMSKLYIALSCK